MMNAGELLAFLEEQFRHPDGSTDHSRIVHVEHIPPCAPEYPTEEPVLHPRLVERLRALGIRKLYSHQAAAVSHALAGRHLILTTGTASGKTLCFNLPVLHSLLNDPRNRALYLYPIKALAQDQLGKLDDFGFFPHIRHATYDGDTPRHERAAIRKGAHIILTNPDMLHMGILPYHTGWAQFLRNLKYVVIDEIHSYRGVFGCHVAQVLRRLRRTCAQYGSQPVFIATSATVGNPVELMKLLTGLDALVLDKDGAPHGRRTFVFWNPPLLGKAGERRSVHTEAAQILSGLARAGARSLVFAGARKSVELIAKYARDALAREDPACREYIAAYRAGYTPQERRSIEQGLFEGRLLGVVATSAMELGVDVGSLDATVLAGYPGTIAAAWQQAGRAGRGTKDALSILVARDDPLDQYLMRHPEYFFGRPRERAVLDPGNARILEQHLRCAASEKPITSGDLALFGENAGEVLRCLEAEGAIVCRNGAWYSTQPESPAHSINIRSASSEAYEIREGSASGPVLGVIEAERVYHTAHPGAVYLHQGDTYLVDALDEAMHVAVVHRENLPYYTDPLESVRIAVLAQRASRPLAQAQASFGDVLVTVQVHGFTTKELHSGRVLGVTTLELPQQSYETEAVWITPLTATVQRLVEGNADLAGSLHAAEHACIGMMPLLALCDRWDLGGVSAPNHPDAQGPVIFIYDAYPGGVGITKSAYERLEELLRAVTDQIRTCRCEDGCPSCVQSPKCGNNNQPLDKRGALLLLEDILDANQTGRSEVAPSAP
ncbi:MAG: DEAD/DEAH box helicase [Chthonomonadales bacterium]